MNAEEKEMGDFISTVLAYTEDAWQATFQKMGKTYQEPTLVLFSGRVSSACGMASAAAGPFYMPGRQTVIHRSLLFSGSESTSWCT